MNWQLLETVTIQSPDQMKDLIERWRVHFGVSALILLSGELGAGKTEFVKQWGKLHGLDGIASPTFALHHSYGSTAHYDLYRISSADDLETIGLWELLSEKKGYVFIEWPERVPESEWPRDWKILKIVFDKRQDSERKLELYLRN